MLIEKLSQAVAFGTEDKREGTAAFLEKERQSLLTNKGETEMDFNFSEDINF